MALPLSTDDLARLEAASRALLSPLAAPDPEAWLLHAGRAVRDLLGGDRVVLAAPGGPSGLYSEDALEIALGSAEYVAAVSAEGYRFSDPVVDAWHEMRKEAGVEAFSWDINQQMVEAQGHRITASPIISDVLMGCGLHEFAGLLKTTPDGDAMVWVLGHERGGLRFGQAAPTVLQALVPSFRAGLDALHRLGAQRRTLDAFADPAAAYGADGRELHRNGALVRLLAAEPERARIEGALHLLARELRRLGFALRGAPATAPPAAERDVHTARGRYALRGTILPPGAFGPDGATLVTVQPTLAPEPLTADEVRGRFGLTRREAEVAVLLAEGLKNDAIAERLFVAPGTARRHTEGVLAKLGVPTRAAAAAKLLAPA